MHSQQLRPGLSCSPFQFFTPRTRHYYDRIPCVQSFDIPIVDHKVWVHWGDLTWYRPLQVRMVVADGMGPNKHWPPLTIALNQLWSISSYTISQLIQVYLIITNYKRDRRILNFVTHMTTNTIEFQDMLSQYGVISDICKSKLHFRSVYLQRWWWYVQLIVTVNGNTVV